MNKQDSIKNKVAGIIGNSTEENPVVSNEGAHWEGEEQQAVRGRKEYTKAELLQFAENFNTAGHKGAKMPRICVAMTPLHYDFVRTMAKASGQTIAQYCYGIFEDAYQRNKDEYNSMVELRSKYWRDKFSND